MSDNAHPGPDAAEGAYNPWAPPEEKASTGNPPAGRLRGGEPQVGAAAGGFAPFGFGPAGAGPAPMGAPMAGPPGGGEQGSPVPPPPIAPSGPGAAPYAAPGGYGYPAPPGYAGFGWPGMPMPPRNGFGTAALALGILSVILFCVYGVVSLVLGILAVVFGVKGRKQADRGEADNRGQAQAGFVLGIVGIVLGVVVIAAIVIRLVVAANEVSSDSDSPYVGDAFGTSAPVLFHG
ncbi:DUF4190 domain-containing protein [Streptomyces colonosanans]|uniref:DUF4190 domain-containing protein n=1 Tax=Streptomyces colonosanans TaxID=1428652 RepID=A0A1S2P7B9_9ACTN|nr:DUF4190 domain-containing protein [Streptomyces colonosanans]OIJ89568.1 hypothetical protein BIV24_19865 [Streptomyces colonosanans]